MLESTMEGDAAHEGDHLVVAHADAVHASIDGQVVRGLHTVSVRHFRIGDGEVRCVDRRGDAILQQQGNSLQRRLTEDEDRCGNAGLTKLDALVYRGNAQSLSARSQRSLGAFHRAVTIGIGLHHSHELSAGLQTTLHFHHVVTNGTQVYLHPGPAPIARGNGL